MPRATLGSDDAACTGHVRFRCAPRLATVVLARLLDSLVRVSRRVGWRRSVLECTLRRLESRKLSGLRPTPRRHPVPCQQFHALLTPFPRPFSVFPHGTCSLSVSRSYLALDGVYHPLQTAIPNSPTRRAAPNAPPPPHRDFTLYVRPFQTS